MTSLLLVVFTIAFSPVVSEDVFGKPNVISAALENVPALNTSAASSNEIKDQLKQSYIAFDFVAIVLLAETNPHLVLHNFYLPIYDREQEKEFFLLI